MTARGNARHMLHRAAVSCGFNVGRCDGAMVDLGPIDLGCNGQDDLAAKGKVLIQRRSGVASSRWHREGSERTWARAGGQGRKGRCGRVACDKGQC